MYATKQIHPDAKELRKRLRVGFRALRKRGYFARMNWQCCQGCGCALVPVEQKARNVFFHLQDAEGITETGKTYLAWSGNGHEIAWMLAEAGLRVTWDGTEGKRILVEVSRG